jgi:autotransporter-associated beta strand protein
MCVAHERWRPEVRRLNGRRGLGGRIAAAGLLALVAGALRAQVVINEVVAANSDRQLNRAAGGYPRLGTTRQWYEPAFDDAQWKSGSGPFGFGSFSGVTLGVNLSAAMQSKLTTLYVRKAFSATAGQASSTNQLQLVTRFNDGFIAFLNGVEVARRNMGNPGMYAYRDQTAFNTNSLPCPAMTIDLGVASNRLWTGTNTLCIQTHNQLIASGDLLCMADLRLGGSSPVSLVTNNAAWKYFAGAAEPSGGLIDYGILGGVPDTATWATLGFNDSTWPEAGGPVGVENASPPDYVLGTNLYSQMYNITPSVYTRAVFSASAAEASSTNALRLVLDYDDGVIVYLNGREVARRNVGVTNTITPCATLASSDHSANGDNGGAATNREETIYLGAASSLLSGGENVLALQLHNASLAGGDLVGRATLSTTGDGARTLAAPADACRYFVGTREPEVVLAGDDEEAGAGAADVDSDAPDSESDWIELYNAGASAVNLTGWSLTDNDGQPRKWYFPAGSAIPAGGYLIVMATGFDVGPANGATYLHTNFRLSSDGEYVGLIDATGAVADEIAPSLPEQSHFHAYARQPSGLFAYSDVATPGAANTGALYAAISAPPDFSHLGGFYAASFQLQMAAPDPSAAVRYTLDGSEPTWTNALYVAPLTINTNTAVRARSFKAGEIPSATVTHHYLVAQSAARQSIAAICFSADPVTGIYGPNASGGPANGEGILAIKGGGYTNSLWYNKGDMTAFNMPSIYGRSAERPAGFEFYPTNGAPLRTDLGLRVSSSSYSRPRLGLCDKPTSRFTYNSATNKPSFNIFFRGELGEAQQDYAFFPDGKVTKFEDIRVRAGKNDIANPFVHDELIRRIFIGTGQEGSIGLFASVYLNGIWKGYFNFCEHLREAFMQQHHNSSASWDVRQVTVTASGDAVKWNAMLAFLRTNNLAVASVYAQAQSYIDTVNVADYLVVNTYAAQGDWPNNNYVTACERSDTGRWRFYVWDAEMSCGLSTGRATSYNSFTSDLVISDAKTTTSKYIPAIYTLLKASPEFRLCFADRVQRHLFREGCLVSNSVFAVFRNLRNTINPIMKEVTGGTVNESYINNWFSTDTRRTNYFAHLVGQGIWPATLAPEFAQHGGVIAPNTQLAVSNPNGAGSVYWTTNGVEPRALGGAAVGSLYAGPILLATTCTLKARVLSAGGEWSPLQEAFFIVPVDVPAFLPAGTADWTADANWSSAPLRYPSGTNVAVFLNAPLTADRDINIRAPVAVGSATFQQNDSAYRNRVRDRSTGNALIFAATNGPAEVVVNGTGAGYVEFEVAADAVLASDLRLQVNNTVGSDLYGALRLRANWRGPGGLIKEGDGVATLTGETKSYTGATAVNRGVLAMTESAAPLASTSVAVRAGGQLRLTSASTAGEARIYGFGGPLSLASLGRLGELPASGQGVLGGLRYQPDTDDSLAVVTGSVAFAGVAGIHVEGSRNALELSGQLAGPFGFIKSGGGTLRLSGQNRRFLAPVVVSNGTLAVDGRIQSAVALASGGKVSGAGRVGPLSGAGTVALDKTVLATPMASGLNYAFAFGAAGSPAYSSPGASANGLLRALAVEPGEADSAVEIYLDVPALTDGDRLRGGIFVESGRGLGALLDRAQVAFYAPDVSGSQTFAGRSYAPYAGGLALSLTAVPEVADFGDGARAGYILEVRVGNSPVSYAAWSGQFVALNGEDAAALDALSETVRSGLPNLLCYAFGFGPDGAAGRLPRLSLADGAPVYRFPFDPGKRDLTYVVEASPDLRVWDRVLFDSGKDWPAGWDGESLTLSDPAARAAGAARQFYRLRVILDSSTTAP